MAATLLYLAGSSTSQRALPAGRPALPLLGLLGISLAAASGLFGDFVGARVEGWAPWVVAGLVYGLARRRSGQHAGLVLTVAAGALAAVGLAQAFGATWFIADVNAFPGRPVMGTLGNPDLFGVCLAGALPFGVVRASRLVFVPVAALLVAAIVASGSRTAWVMLLPTVVLAVHSLRFRRAALLGAAAAVLTALVVTTSSGVDVGRRVADLGESGGTAAGRLYLWRVHAGLLLDTGPLGGGPQAFQRRWPWAQADYLAEHPDDVGFHSDLRHAHADVVELAVDWGWIGLLLAGWWTVRLLRARRRDEPDDRPAAARTALIALLIGGLAYPVLFQIPSLALAALCAGLLSARLPAAEPAATPRRALWTVAAAVGLVLTLFWVGRHTLSEAVRSAGLRAEVAGHLDEARALYGRAARIDPNNPLAQWMASRSLLAVDPAAALRAADAVVSHLPTPAVYALRALAAEAAGELDVAAASRATLRHLHPEL